MRKVFTLFCVLMAAFFSIGVANAQSLVALQTSPKPGDTFDANTHWFIMTLKGRFITTTVHDESGNFKVSSTNVADISTDAAWWCVVGDDTKGYTFYNKAAGTKQVLGIQNLTGDGGDLNTYGASRAKMYAATTTNSTELKGVGITFDFKTSSTDKEYYVCLKGTNRYLNERGSYLAYWDNSAALGNDGSCVKFYDASTYWYDKYLGSYQTLATNVRNNMGTTAFTYPESAVTDFQKVVTEKLNGIPTNISYADAIQKESEIHADLDVAKTTLRKSINGPAADKIYKLKNPNQRKYIHASLSWTAGQVFPLNQTDNDRSIGFIFEKNENGTYKVKSADTGMYVGPYKNNAYTSTASKDKAVDCYIYAFGDCDSKVIIGTSNDLNASTWFHGNGTVLWNWAALGENSCWQCTEVSLDEFNNLTDKRRASLSSVLLLPGVADKLQSDLNAYDANQTAETWGTLLTNVNNTIDSKYYRINNKRDDVNVLATDGGVKPKMYSPTDGNKLVSSIWKFKYGEAVGLKLSNVNNPNKYVASLNEAGGNKEKIVNPFTTYDSGIVFVLSKADGQDYYVIRDGNGNVLNGENASKDGSVNYWNGGLSANDNSVKWQINEVTSLEVDLNNAGNGKSYASVYLPFSISSVNDGVKAYVAKKPETSKVTFIETTNGVKAENGFLLISDNAAATATVNIGESNTESNMLGTLTNRSLTNEDKNTYRVFGRNSSNVVGFFTPSGNLNEVKANRGYFTVSNGGALRLNFEDSVVSGIDAIEANQALHNAPIFDLSGRRVMNTVKGGLYIQNGRKFIVK